jgi:nitrogen regulatory protein PII 1
VKLLKAIIRPERESAVIKALEREGIYGMTKIDVLGRGQQKGIQVGEVTYDELAKLMLMIVVEDADCPRTVETIRKAAFTGHFGDGRIFVLPVEQAVTIRTGENRL